jgi:zinc protease
MKPWEEIVLANGLIFLYRQSPGFPLATASMLIQSGSREESPSDSGLASFTTELMLQGTRSRTSIQMAHAIESVGASLGAQASEDYSEAGFVAPVDHVDRLLDILAETLTEPAFAAKEIEKERSQTLASLKSRHDSIFNVAYDALNARLFGAHPYGRPIDGRVETVKRFVRKDFDRWHRSHLRPDRSVLAMVSPLPGKAVRRLVEKHLKSWKSPVSPVNQDLIPLSLPTASAHVASKAHFEQAYLMTGVSAPPVLDPDYIPLKVLNTIMGGGMSSRLFMRLREELGLAYEVSSFYPTHVLPSQWILYLGTPPEKLGIAKREMERLLDQLQRKPPSSAEVQQAISMIKGAYLMEHQTRRRQAWYAAWWKMMGKSPEQDTHFLRAVEAVTPSQLHALARRLLAQPRITVEVTPR